MSVVVTQSVSQCIHYMCTDFVEPAITSRHNGNLDIGIWNCDYFNIPKLQKKGPSPPIEKSVHISFRTWDFSGDVSNNYHCVKY